MNDSLDDKQIYENILHSDKDNFKEFSLPSGLITDIQQGVINQEQAVKKINRHRELVRLTHLSEDLEGGYR
jgi:hypothetical protein